MILFTFLIFETAVCLHFVLTNRKTPIWKLWAVFPRCWCYSCIGPYTFYLGTLLGKIGYNIPKRLNTKGQRHKSTERLNMKLWYLLLWHTWLLFDRLEHWVYFVRKNYLLCNYTENERKNRISTLKISLIFILFFSCSRVMFFLFTFTRSWDFFMRDF